MDAHLPSPQFYIVVAIIWTATTIATRYLPRPGISATRDRGHFLIGISLLASAVFACVPIIWILGAELIEIAPTASSTDEKTEVRLLIVHFFTVLWLLLMLLTWTWKITSQPNESYADPDQNTWPDPVA